MRQKTFGEIGFSCLLVAAALMLAVVTPSGWAEAAPTARPSAAATFTSQDASGCVTTEVSVFVRGNGETIGPQTSLRLSILKVNECEDSVLLQAEGRANLRAGAFNVAPDLATARLETTVRLKASPKQQNLTATVRLSWTATEEAVVAARRDEPEEPGKFIRMKAPVERTLRLAAASGTVSTGAGTLTPTAAESAWLAIARGGTPAERTDR